MAEAVEATLERRIGQEGSRWYNVPPTGPELSKWFEENVELHDGLKPKPYIPGVTMIPATEKAKNVTGWQGATPIIQQIENLVFVPYAKVETRVKYFHDLMALKESDWVGVIEPVEGEFQSKKLPPGFFAFPVATEKGVVNYVCCSMKVTVFERGNLEWREIRNSRSGEVERVRVGKTIIDAAPATKMIPTLGRWGADDFSLMKAETGAVGRALGMAGMLVIPGTGIATAEDMQEASAMEGRTTPSLPEDGEQADVPPVKDAEGVKAEELTDLRQQAVLLLNTIKAEFPPLFAEFIDWAKERKIGEVGKVEDPRIVRGVIRKAERELVEAREEKDKPDEVPAPTDPGIATN
jgi:hypothetical protein